MEDLHAPVQMLWIGGPLSTMERLVLTSWLANGHEVHLYTYGKPANAIKGLHICDAREIIPEHADFKNLTGGHRLVRFSDLFSFTLLHKLGGIWAGIDVVCLKPLDFAAGMDTFFATEIVPAQPGDEGNVRVRASGCVMKAPAGSALMLNCLETAKISGDSSDWASTGPMLLHGAIEKHQLTAVLLNPNLFCPVPFWNTIGLITGITVLPPESYGVNLWNESWRRNFFDKNAHFQPHSLFERLKTYYLGRKDGESTQAQASITS